ncbi:MAG: HAD-IC family P-type ATPase [Rhodoblastus sp.]|nr:HAD-IC family P-type ATPase [Rhodoblastus sp.]
MRQQPGAPAPLTEAEARESLARAGSNELEALPQRGVGRILRSTLSEPMFAMLLAAAALYLLLGDIGEGALLVGGAILSIGLVVMQETRNERAISALRALAAPTARVLRAEGERRIPAREIAPRDFILIGEGERVPADAVVLRGDVLAVDESILTGESAPVLKAPCSGAPDMEMDPEPGDPSSVVFSGTMTTRGQATLLALRTGRATRLGRIGRSLSAIEQGQTPLQIAMRRVVGWLGAAALGFCVLVAVAYWYFRGDWIEAGLAGLTLAISLTPEEFPMVLVVFLALGSWRLARHNVLARRSAVIETLGAVSMLCVDKTGTLTQNSMEVAALAADRTVWRPEAGAPAAQGALLDAALRACAVEPSDPMDRALHRLAESSGISFNASQSIKTYPLRPDLLAFIHAWRADAGAMAAAKGAPEAIFHLCRMPEAERAAILEALAGFAEEGLRVLAVASRENFDVAREPENQGFRFEGLVAFRDPLRPDVGAAIAEARGAGVAVAMITGDHPATAVAIAREAGIDCAKGVLTGAELAAMTPEELRCRLQETRIFARVRPEQKLALVEGFKALGHVVAMTGDGVNDAPALKAADAGVAMGKRGSDVAREAADIVLLDDNFASIVGGVRLGRRIFANLRKALVYISAIHVPVAGLALLPIVMGLPPILFPAHVMMLEMVIDPVCALVFEGEPGACDAMRRPPRPRAEPLFGLRHIGMGLLDGLVLLVAVYALYLLALRHELPAEQARATAYIALVCGNLALAFATAAEPGTPFFDARRRIFWIIAAAAAALLAVVVAFPVLAPLFRFQAPPLPWLAASFGVALVAGAWSGVARLLRGA